MKGKIDFENDAASLTQVNIFLRPNNASKSKHNDLYECPFLRNMLWPLKTRDELEKKLLYVELFQ